MRDALGIVQVGRGVRHQHQLRAHQDTPDGFAHRVVIALAELTALDGQEHQHLVQFLEVAWILLQNLIVEKISHPISLFLHRFRALAHDIALDRASAGEQLGNRPGLELRRGLDQERIDDVGRAFECGLHTRPGPD